LADLIPSDITAEIDSMFDPSQIPEDENIRRLSRRCSRLAVLDGEIEELEARLETLTRERNELARHELPDLFEKCLIDRIGVPGENVDVVVEAMYHANIKADWPEEQRERGFEALERMGGGDLIRVTLEIQFGKGELELARTVLERLSQWNEFGNRPARMNRNVPWNTLTAYVREQIKAGRPVPMEELGAAFGRVCKIKKRKS